MPVDRLGTRGTVLRAFTLVGELHRLVTLTVTDPRGRWEQHRAEVTFGCAKEGPQHHTCEGPLLREVVSDAGPAFDVRRRKDRSRFLLAVTGGDGRHAVLSWAEIDADFGDAPRCSPPAWTAGRWSRTAAGWSCRGTGAGLAMSAPSPVSGSAPPISPCTPRPRAGLHANFPPEPARQIRTTCTPGA